MTFIALLFFLLSIYVADVAGSLMCVCNKDEMTQVKVYDSPQSNTTIGVLNPHQCKALVNTSVSYQGWIAIQIDNQEGFVERNADFILVAECPSVGFQTTSAPVAISTVHTTSGCTAVHVNAALTGNLTLCPPYVREVAKAHCHLLTQHGHSCYELNRGHVIWSRANQLCTERGGHLVTINNAQENSYLHNILTKTNHTNRVWIGLRDRNSEGHFHWVTGEQMSYTNWSVNATHDGAGHAVNNKQDCGVITPVGHWQDVWCGGHGDSHHSYSYICEYKTRGSGSVIIG